ncbi:tyrosine-type recombinase/integrase [Intrasporangium sp.]|uniref:tyrosine-type recombinase/integrase n=1 Tax=Intrasporangium sp. TaxID=1925024 RepID=UPI00293B57AD|nr:tyrosine-type recombinase/integrase [Intrasporangium sp.]MDV3221870.1 site-specific integrase [Intrasporangium sp.]
MILKRPNGKWRVQVKHRGRVVADRTFVRRGDAVRWEMEQKRLLLSGEFVSPSAGRITVAELADDYRDSRQGQVSVRAWESDESALRVHIVPAFGRLPISSISSVQVERFLTDLAVSRSVRTAARVRTTLRGLFRYAVRTRRLPKSPAEDVPLPRPDSRTGKVVEVDPFTLDQLLEVVEAQRKQAKRYAEITLVLALTGVRFGELRGLRVRDLVVVPYPGLVVKRSIPQSGRTGAVIERATTKSGRSRLVPLTERVRPVVESWAAGRDPDELLFPAPEGGYLHAQNWRRAVHWTKTGLGRRPHDLRHTAASLWIAAGVDIKTVSSWLGHSTAKLTLDTYGHLMGTDADRAAIERVNRALVVRRATEEAAHGQDGGSR